jgi:hypothetical protein
LKNLRQKRRFRPISLEFAQQFQCVAGKFPETIGTGNFSEEQGIFFDGTGNSFVETWNPSTLTGLMEAIRQYSVSPNSNHIGRRGGWAKSPSVAIELAPIAPAIAPTAPSLPAMARVTNSATGILSGMNVLVL